MVEAVMFWNEPNNKSHWDFEIDPEWTRFSEMVKLAALRVREINPDLTRVLGGISPIDAGFVDRLKRNGLLDVVDVVAVHGFPLDWNQFPSSCILFSIAFGVHARSIVLESALIFSAFLFQVLP